VGSVRGKMTQKKVGRAVYDDDLIMDEKKQVLYSDVMHIDGQKFLVTVCEPLHLTLQCPVERETATVLGVALQGQLELLRSRGFVPVRVHTDPQSAFRSLTTSFENVVIDPSGAGDYVPKVDTKIRRIKEVYRGVKLDLPWKLPPTLVKDLVAYAVSRINIRRTTAINQNVCPRVLFTGLRVDFRKELSLAFGDYCEVFDGSDNTSKSRSVPCVALYPCSNVTGSWNFYNLLTNKRIRRSIWKKMVTTSSFSEKMNALVGEEETLEPEQNTIEENGMVQQERIEQEINAEEPTQGPSETPEEASDAEEVEENENVVPELEPQGDEESDDEAESESEDEENAETMIRRSARIRAGTKKPARYAMHTKLRGGSHNDDATNEQIKAAEKAEIQLVFQDLKAIEPVKKEDIPQGIPAFNTHLFTVEKFKADGTRDKFKSRLVAHGNEQDTTLYPDRSSPTAQMHSLMCCLAVAACNPQYHIAKLDVKGAFIQTEMSGTPVYVKCAGKLRERIIETYPELGRYVGRDRVLYGVLRKALYGCVQASKLWFERLTGFLKRVGYVNSEVEPCVFKRVDGDRVYLLIVYVDDILMIVTEEEVTRLHGLFVEEFRWITMEVGRKQSYLGMQISFRSGEVRVDMKSYIEKILITFGKELVQYQNPGRKDLFMVEEEDNLSSDEVKTFHTAVAKLLYLAKRARPDIMTVVSFLCTQVKGPTVGDLRKLRHLLGYLERTKDRPLVLKPQGMFNIEAYVDASFATHMDGKSHTGVLVKVGVVGVYFASRKQKCVTKSPTEAELVALLDNIGFVELFHEFISFILDCAVDIPMVYQDNTSIISLVTLGGGKVRTKHLRTRMFLVREAIEERKLRVRYVHTSQMSADGLTKILDGSDFDFFVDQALGANKSTGGR
jgi:hypothetical protein